MKNKTNSNNGGDVPRAYIKEKYVGVRLKDSYAPPAIPIKEIERRMGKRPFYIMCRHIDGSCGAPKY